jgi:hypothetical protein
MSRFNEQNTADIASITVFECRGSRRELLPFTNKQSLLSALRRAEKAYLKEQGLCRDLTPILQKEKEFANLSARAVARLLTGFDNTFSLMERVARESRRIKVVVRPGPKRYLKKDKVNKAPLREFAYSFKLFWDKTMKASVGHDFNNTVPFSIATPILTAASKVLSDQDVSADIKSILRDVQSSKYNPEEFRQSDVLAIFRPQLAKAAGIRLP